MQQDIIYGLLKDQCMGVFIAEIIGRTDIATVGPHAKIILDKVNLTLNSQLTALSNLVTSSLLEKSASNIFKTTTPSSYDKFTFLLMITKILTSHFEGEHTETAKLIVNEIQIMLEDLNFKKNLYEDPEYIKLVSNKQLSEQENEKLSQFSSYWKYGVGTLLFGGIGFFSIAFLKSFKNK